mmetsp:Transcript_66663/g.201211  ORF Transcript_66663/g.201211 Transcript_66663/m.201211 type:complete len:353 (+) Transcript_66663:271-1329(+)
MPLGELLRVALRGIREARHGALGEEEAKHAPDVTTANLVPRVLGRGEDAVDKLPCEAVELLVDLVALQLLERLDARGHGQGVAAERPSLVHRPRGGHHLHDVPAAAVGAHRQAAADDLAHGRDVRLHAEVLLRPAIGDAEPGHDLIEDEERAVLCRELAQALQELLRGRDEAGVADDGLQDHGGHLVLLQQGLHGRQVVVLRAERRVRGTGRNAWRVRQAQGGHAGARLHQEGVRVAVVAALELDNLLALREGPHEPQHAHAGLGAAVGEAHHLDRRHGVYDHLRELVLQGRGRAEGGALRELRPQSVQDFIICVTQDGRAPGADIVDVLVAIHVPRIGALHAIEDHRVAAH